MHANCRNIRNAPEVACQIETIHMHQIESCRSQQIDEPRPESPRLVQVRRVDTAASNTANMIPDEPDPAMFLWNRKDLDVRKFAQGLSCGAAVVPGAGAASALETQSRDIERACEQPQHVVGANPHPSVGWKRQRLTQEEEARAIHRTRTKRN